MGKSFRDLVVWEKSVDLSEMIYRLTADFPREEIYGLSSQMRRSAVSIASNIAEGSARGTNRDFRQFVKLAKGSTCELQTQLVIARRLKFGDADRIAGAEEFSEDVARMLSGLMTYLTTRIKAEREKESRL